MSFNHVRFSYFMRALHDSLTEEEKEFSLVKKATDKWIGPLNMDEIQFVEMIIEADAECYPESTYLTNLFRRFYNINDPRGVEKEVAIIQNKIEEVMSDLLKEIRER